MASFAISPTNTSFIIFPSTIGFLRTARAGRIDRFINLSIDPCMDLSQACVKPYAP
jgi:hypothetical protein